MDIYQHFRLEEHAFIDQAVSWKEMVELRHQLLLTDFLDPREQQILANVIGKTNEEIQLSFLGGLKKTERKRAIIAPYYLTIEEHDFKLSLLEANFERKFNILSHRDVLGAFLSLGFDRKKLGDIIVNENIIQLIIAKEISTYVQTNLTKIKRASIRLQEKDLSDMIDINEEWIESDHTVSSMRLDVILKEIYRTSRKKAAELIQKKAVKVNFKIVEDVSYRLYEGDLISVKGKGRSKLLHIHGRTKKNKWRITSAILRF